MGDLGHLASVAPWLLDALFVQGRDDEALRLTDRWTPERLTVPDDADGQISLRRVRAKLLARRGEVEEAERLAREAVSIAARTDFLDPHAQAFADLATVLRLAGRPEESAAAAKEAIRLYEEKGNIAAAAALAATMSASAPR
jgi:tetratricopeptide (TPR) repeat protein